MKIYSHRVNTKSQLLKVPEKYGVEIDIRTDSGQLILSHDPFSNGELLSDWLACWKGQPIILNVKEDAIEEEILDLLEKFEVGDFFFLDQSYPSIRRMINQGMRQLATRVSDYEDLATALNSGSEWVWLDSFSGNWTYLKDAVPRILQNQQKTCLVSPELQRSNSVHELKSLQNFIVENSIKIDAVCTKTIEDWET
jgi:hypothetical protein